MKKTSSSKKGKTARKPPRSKNTAKKKPKKPIMRFSREGKAKT